MSTNTLSLDSITVRKTSREYDQDYTELEAQYYEYLEENHPELVPKSWLAPVAAPADRSQPVERARYPAAATRLEAVAQSLSSLAETVNEVYDAFPRRCEDFRWVIDNTHDSLCFNCGRREQCWKQEYAATLEGMEALRPLLTPAVMTSFEAGMAARETRGETEQVEFVHPPRADLELATAEGERAVAKVRFLAELRNRLTKNEAETVDERRTAEHWTFERGLNASDPNWVLARVGPASA